MFAGLQRHVDASHAADLVAPHAAAVHHHVRRDVTGVAVRVGPVNARYAAPLFGDVGDLDALFDQGTVLTGTFGQRQRDVGRIALAIQRQINRTLDALKINVRVQFFDALVADFLDLNAKCAGHASLAIDLFAALFGQCDSDRTAAFEPCRDACFGLKRAVQFLRILRQLRHVRRRTQLCNQASGMPSGARCQLFAFQQNNVFPPQFGEVISHRAADHTTTNDDNAGFFRKIGHGRKPYEMSYFRVWHRYVERSPPKAS